ncbi:hypothetical protein [Streptomyces sp. TS71-3]|uniref:hypothetical protein n=1 Tax=Streptomyces sp. TS71-3 TaxID=2733862 RepID=UPI001B1C93A8|nr:hypothetical protein [Streptomyces sp. TS71-3]GHJ34498.1 hypothetical protein Sm713_01070 [Streptomyces sp. TS71-3]
MVLRRPRRLGGPARLLALRRQALGPGRRRALSSGETRSYQVDDLAPIGHTGRVWAVGGYELVVGEHSAETHELIEYSDR